MHNIHSCKQGKGVCVCVGGGGGGGAGLIPAL